MKIHVLSLIVVFVFFIGFASGVLGKTFLDRKPSPDVSEKIQLPFDATQLPPPIFIPSKTIDKNRNDEVKLPSLFIHVVSSAETAVTLTNYKTPKNTNPIKVEVTLSLTSHALKPVSFPINSIRVVDANGRQYQQYELTDNMVNLVGSTRMETLVPDSESTIPLTFILPDSVKEYGIAIPPGIGGSNDNYIIKLK